MKEEDKKENYNVVADFVSITAKPGSTVTVSQKPSSTYNLGVDDRINDFVDWQSYIQQKDSDAQRREIERTSYPKTISELFKACCFGAPSKDKAPKMKKTANISRVHFSGDKTIVVWDNGDKTIVTCQKDETFDKEKGLAMAIVKYVYGNNSAYNDVINLFLEKDEEKSAKKLTKEKTETVTTKKVTKKVEKKSVSFVDKLNKKGE